MSSELALHPEMCIKLVVWNWWPESLWRELNQQFPNISTIFNCMNIPPDQHQILGKYSSLSAVVEELKEVVLKWSQMHLDAATEVQWMDENQEQSMTRAEQKWKGRGTITVYSISWVFKISLFMIQNLAHRIKIKPLSLQKI